MIYIASKSEWTESGREVNSLGYWERFGKQKAPTEGTGVADQSMRVLKRTWPLTTVDKLVLSQEDQPQTHRSTRQISRETGLAQSSVVRIICCDLGLNFLKCPKSRCAHELTADIVSFTYLAVSQGSVATQLMCGGIILIITLLQIFHRVCQWKNF